MVDIIIPYYNAEDTIGRCLASIKMQTIADQCVVTVVDDHSEKPFEPGVWAELLNLNVWSSDQNKGPGSTRQAGIDTTREDYIMFIDADDTFASPFAVKLMVDAIKGTNADCAIGRLREELGDGTFKDQGQRMIWMHGKIYRRKFLDRNGIRFGEGNPLSYANEDNGFNSQVILLTDKIIMVDDYVYNWHYAPNSTTRENDGAWNWGQGFEGYCANMAMAIDRARRKNPDTSARWAAHCLCYIYLYIENLKRKAPENIERAEKAARDYYNRAVRPLDLKIDTHMYETEYQLSLSSHVDDLCGFAPAKTLWDFIGGLKDDSGDI